MTPNELITKGSNFLKQNNIKSHMLDSELILSSVTGKQREDFLLKDDFKLNLKQIKSFNHLISRRALLKEPIAYLTNKKEFWSIKFNVDKAVLIPRPETEILVEKIIKYYKGRNPFILDIGTGSGCIIISLLREFKKSKGIAIDISNKALNIAKRNSINYDTFDRLKFINSSISTFDRFKFDIIVSNPPYIAQHQLKNLDKDIKILSQK